MNEINVYVNVTHHNMTVILKVNLKNLEWNKCLCKCYTSQYDCYSQSKYEKSWVGWLFMWMLHMTVVVTK